MTLYHIQITQIGKLYSNPVYQMELARRQRESSSLVAASSADDITLMSKVPLHKPAVVSTLATTATPPGNRHTHSRSMDVMGIEEGESWSTQNNQNGKKVPEMEGKKPPEDKRMDYLKRLQPLSRSQEFNIQTAGHKRPKTVEALPSGVHMLRMQYESPTPPHVTPTHSHVTPTLSHTTPTHLHTFPTKPPARSPPSLQPNGKSGRCNSVGNSDSGRESMVLETDV